jgi:hypothetical protein
MEIVTKPPKIRILSGTPAKVEAELNLLLDNYVPSMWAWSQVKDEVIVSVVLVSQSQVRQAQMAAALHGQRNLGT